MAKKDGGNEMMENGGNNALVNKLADIQCKLQVPKSKKAKTYSYRSAEDILEKVKPLLNGLVLTLNDDILVAGDRFYVKATATISDGIDAISATAFAREESNQAFMSAPQFTGACSSYARKYALCGLFLLDDNRDVDDIANETQTQKVSIASTPKRNDKEFNEFATLKHQLAKELETLGITKDLMVEFIKYAFIDVKTPEGIKAFLADDKRAHLAREFIGLAVHLANDPQT